MAKYMAPDFDVTLFEIEDEITVSFDGNEEGWNPSETDGTDWD